VLLFNFTAFNILSGRLNLLHMRIDDRTGRFNQNACDELIQFVANELLSNELDIYLLDVVRIRNDGRTNYFGYWTAIFHYDPDDKTRIVAVTAVIVLNYFYLKSINSLKRTLAHEYGHHWTLSYLAINQGLNMSQQLPHEYYQIRPLELEEYSHDYSRGWNRCDREIIAEDYRVLFAPEPHNQNHRMIASSSDNNTSIREYIRSLAVWI
jgi:hypothetical protein